jgi:hypothetical protein
MPFSRTLVAGLLLVVASGGAVPCTGLRAELASRLDHARVVGRWQEYLPYEVALADSLAAARWTRVPRGIALAGAAFHESYPSIAGPECLEECAKCVHRSFIADGDTLGFTIGSSPEFCSESPRLLWRSQSGRHHQEALVPLFNWNVEALWCTGRFVVFGLHAEYEGGSAGDALAFWDLETGRWAYAPPGEQLASYSIGLALTGILPAWPKVQAAELGDAIILRDGGRAVALWPVRSEWSVLEAETGTPVQRGPGVPPGRAILKSPAAIPLGLLDEMRSALRRSDPQVGPPEVLEIMSPACPPDSSLVAVVVHAPTPQGMFGHTGEIFGVFLADRLLSRVVKTLEVFPELRQGDYTAFFVAEAAADSIIVIGQGESYGDQQVVHRFDCGHGE